MILFCKLKIFLFFFVGSELSQEVESDQKDSESRGKQTWNKIKADLKSKKSLNFDETSRPVPVDEAIDLEDSKSILNTIVKQLVNLLMFPSFWIFTYCQIFNVDI